MIIPADVLSVYDGDTITVEARPWPGMVIETKVRVNGIDTPEIRGKCDSEKELAKKARDAAAQFVGQSVQLHNVELGKYAGRVVASVYVGDKSLADFLIESGLARPYDGKSKRQGWCE